MHVQAATSDGVRRVHKKRHVVPPGILPHVLNAVALNKTNVRSSGVDLPDAILERLGVPARSESTAVLATLHQTRPGGKYPAALYPVPHDRRKSPLPQASVITVQD